MEIHTSDRATFRRCRRKWGFSSPVKGNLQPLEGGSVSGPLWFGTGFHFAMEDYHGLNRFGHPAEAFMAYTKAFRGPQLPDDIDELTELGLSMLTYYTDIWAPKREVFETLQLDNGPAVEVKWRLPLFYTPAGEVVDYVGAFDRVVRDHEGRLWIVDYKTAARLDSANLETDAQISAYTWAGRELYGEDIEGVIWIQFVKKVAKPPILLANGEDFSQNKAAHVPHGLYRAALLEKFGEVPPRYIPHLNYLAEQEGPEGDDFIHMFRVRRSAHSSKAAHQNILAEVHEMLEPNLALYPNPTRDCSWDCPFRTPCMTMDDGYDWEQLLSSDFEARIDYTNRFDWRGRIKWPDPTP